MQRQRQIAVIGGGPAGLIAAETLARQPHTCVHLYERKPTPARKFLMAGRGGLNLTHSEDMPRFLTRYGAGAEWLRPYIDRFTPQSLRDWSAQLGEDTFVGSSGRVFPRAMKASPLLRAWRARLTEMGVVFHLQHDWKGWAPEGALVFENAHGTPVHIAPDATVLALGGGSWAKLGSDGSWVPLLRARGVEVAPFLPANVGFAVAWSPYFREKFAGTAIKPVALSFQGQTVHAEAMVAAYGLEGGAVYALSAILRDHLMAGQDTVVALDLNPALAAATLAARLAKPRGGRSLANILRRDAGLSPVAIALLQEAADGADPRAMSAEELAIRIKSLPLRLTAAAPIDRAISTAGGIARTELDEGLMLRRLPGVFAAGEMIDWEAPTGGYLLQASFATGVAAADGVIRWLDAQ